jgi:two-component system phosphate regulon response regulator PhoB
LIEYRFNIVTMSTFEYAKPDNPTILIVDDEEDVRELVGSNLRRAGMRVVEAADGLQGINSAKSQMPNVIVLDVMMPGRDGLQVCSELRGNEVTKDIPVLMLTAKGQTSDRIAGLEKGADDYLAKPFSPRELVLRVQALLRRAVLSKESGALKEGPFELDLAGVRLTIDGEAVDLTLLEFKLVHLLVSRKGAVVDRDTILREVWGYADNVRTRTLDTHVKRLREKLGPYADWIQTSRGFGYVFKAPV